jgi:starvation-inducible DNA-binding protein
MKPTTAPRTNDRRDKSRRPLATPTDLSPQATRQITEALNPILADAYALYLKYKNFHWHVAGPHFPDYHELFDEQAAQVLAMTDPLAERVRKIGGHTLTSIGHVTRLQRIEDNDEDFVDPQRMLDELCRDNKAAVAAMRQAHEVADEHNDVATASLLENFIDEAEQRVWFLFETAQREMAGGH